MLDVENDMFRRCCINSALVVQFNAIDLLNTIIAITSLVLRDGGAEDLKITATAIAAQIGHVFIVVTLLLEGAH